LYNPKGLLLMMILTRFILSSYLDHIFETFFESLYKEKAMQPREFC
jgi:hypothetical protein